jgi:hypothetical protein
MTRLHRLWHARLLEEALKVEAKGDVQLAIASASEALKLCPEPPRWFLHTVEPWGPALKIVDDALAQMQPFMEAAFSLYGRASGNLAGPGSCHHKKPQEENQP